MNTQNADFLKKSLLNLGFGESLNAELDKQIAARSPEFNLQTRHEFNQKAIDYTLHFKAGNEQDMYFFNRYDAKIPHENDPAKDLKQSFFINKGSGITAKEAFNLMEGRAVHKQLYNLEGQKYQAWITLDKDNLTDKGNMKLKHYHENYGYDLKKVISGVGIKEMDNVQGQENLLRSLKKGNAQQVTVTQDGNDTKYYIAANPQFKTIDFYDSNLKKIKREALLEPEIKTNDRLKISEQHKEDVLEKKPRKNAKLKV
ncbi:hypothetical protein [Mucilaginibacter pedocola]|uniref:DUF3945 domain-containing protein n=1 Tax=Mucilaginibacter pedocola TaxID=1792845 RepID=A0A1S9PMZ7_9SPHI|nr:hypothetical protein [Mucilaginibacter pedocola]OOQ62301.1 hypothetical protein BC343_02500 [Mucilaginibacter pedocola]